MTWSPDFVDPPPSRNEVDCLPGPVLIEFGTDWCGHCQAAQGLIAEVLADHPAIRHLRIEDGPGRRLGRSFHVKLWPTLILMVDGQERGRLVRPTHPEALQELLAS